DRSDGSADVALLVTVSWSGPPLPAPREIFYGMTHAGVVTASTTLAMPAPCRHVGSSPFRAVFSPFGEAVFISRVRTCDAAIFVFFAWRISAASPATCGEDIDVPLIVL